MPWTKTDYPPSMKNLPAAIRNKAIEIANALVEEGMEDGLAIATAISRAKDWGASRGKKVEDRRSSRISDVKKHGRDRYVVPRQEDEWALKVEGRRKAEKIFSGKGQAVSQARKEAKEQNGALTIQRKTGKIEKRVSYNPNKRARTPVRKKKRV